MKNNSQQINEEEGKIFLQLYITGMSENSMRAIRNITQLCEQYLQDRVDLEVVDIYKDPSLAEKQEIVFSPSLVRQFPLPKKTFIGDLSDTKKLMLGLGITLKE
ncbi:MAG: circadian clock KaiB family protein [Lacibacter sp.]|nr:circadian clock KaiB family protein [Lacibacter sp.]